MAHPTDLHKVRDTIVGSFVLVTSDQELLAAGVAASMDVLDPEAENAMATLRGYRAI